MRFAGVTFPTRMSVAQLSGGALWIESPVPASFHTLQRIVALGSVRYLVAGTPLHVWRLEAWHTLFPEAALWVPRPSPLAWPLPRLPFAGTLAGSPPAAWAADLDQLPFRGNPLAEEVVFLHRPSRTVIIGDFIQNHAHPGDGMLRRALLRLMGVGGPGGGVGLDIRLTFTNRQRARQSLAALLAWDFDRLVLAHGPCVEHDAKGFVRRAFHWLG